MTAGRALAAGAFAVSGPALAACGPARAREAAPGAPLLAFAAADLREALPEVAAAYRRAGGDSVVLTFGATGDLAVQIANGAPADVFFAADTEALARLAAERAVDGRTRRVYALGRLALLGAPAGAADPLRLADLAGGRVRTVSIADPARAPYGRAAREALERAGLWARVRPKLVYAPNVAQAYRAVRDGNADAGLVARASLGRASGGPAPGGAAPPGAATPPYALVDTALYAPIRQAAAVVASTARGGRARRFLAYATGPAGFAVFARYGFAPPPAPAPGAVAAGAAPGAAAAR